MHTIIKGYDLNLGDLLPSCCFSMYVFEKRLRLTLFQRCGIQRCKITPWTNIPYMIWIWSNHPLDPRSSVEGFDTDKWPNNFRDEFANGSSRTKKTILLRNHDSDKEKSIALFRGLFHLMSWCLVSTQSKPHVQIGSSLSFGSLGTPKVSCPNRQLKTGVFLNEHFFQDTMEHLQLNPTSSAIHLGVSNKNKAADPWTFKKNISI